MLLNETTKSTNSSQFNQIEGVALNNSTSTVGVTVAVGASVGSCTIVAGTPLKSRSHNRDRQQSDDKQENTNIKSKSPPKPVEEFYKDLQQFHEKRGTPIMHMPKITGREVDLHRLYCEVTERGGFQKVNNRDEWEEILPELGLKEKIVNGSAALKYIYRRVLEKYERLNYFGEDPDKIVALEAADMAEFCIGIGRGKGSRYPSSYGTSNSGIINSVAMSYNYRQHHVNMDRRRQFKLSTDLHKPSAYEKLMLSLLSPLPNDQDFAINACTLMANENKHTLKLNEYPKLLDALLAHTGVFSDYSMRKLFQHIYSGVRHHSLYGFWHDLLNDKPQILDLYTDEQTLRESALIDDYDDSQPEMEGILQDCKELDFLNLRTGLGTQDYIGQRVLQVISIFRNLSFQEENLGVLVKNKTFLRFLVMSSNIRWSNVHMQAFEITGNIAAELEISDPTIDDLSRSLMATICDGIEGQDRGVIINCLEILYKLCQKDTNEDYVLKCLNMNFYNTITMFLSLNDIMLLLFTLEAIYALTSLGPKSCHCIMQVRGIIDQLVSLITVEAQSYGPDGCILMRVVETVPGNMLPMVAQNIANLQNVANIQKQTTNSQHQMVVQMKPKILLPNPVPANEIPEIQSEHPQQQIQMPQNFTQDDEQYALAWLGATFERTSSMESHIETQELYRMYLSHCQKSGKHSVVNHLHFPKLVRLIFTGTVGPSSVKKSDGSELPGLHYVSIRLRAQPLPLQKSILSVGGQTASLSKQTENPGLAKKAKKKVKQQIETTISPSLSSSVAASVNNTSTICEKTSNSADEIIKKESTSVNPNSQALLDTFEKPLSSQTVQPVDIKCEEKMVIEKEELSIIETQTQSVQQVSEPMQIEDSNQVTQPTTSFLTQNASTSLIKSLLANKVNQRQQKQKDVITTIVATNTTTPTVSSPILPVNPVTTTQPIKVASTAITALVNNSLMQHTPVKVGQTTIKPLNPHPSNLEKKTQITESTPPPLAPLSGVNVAKDTSGRPIILANQMLVDILDKKIVDPPIPGIIQKRKLEDQMGNNKRLTIESSSSSSKEETQVTPSKNAANLYAEMAASILEDEDLEEFSTQSQQPTLSLDQQSQTIQQTSLIIPAKVQQQSTAPSIQSMQRQLVFQSNQPQLKLTQPGTSTNQQLPNAVATIKTDQGLQTVPVILQQKSLEVQQPQTQIIQQMIQPAPQQQQTQYVLATNQQGQTYLVAQQTQQQQPPPPPQPTQTVLVTQTPQQQSTGQKTIIILQQQTLPGQQQQIITTGPPGQGQKMIMTTSQGQQVLVTQRPQTPQQIFINPQTGAATHIQHVPVQTQSRQIIQTSNTQPQQQQSQQVQAGQISPSLLNQLNQIPATIKLHQPIAQQTVQSQQPQPATITRMGKTVSLVQSAPPTPTPPVAIPQLQQHQSIIQQHIISGPSEKRHVILSSGSGGGGGVRAIEIKETVITQAQQPPQQCQLNSQTIITQQPQVTTAVTQSTTSTSSILHTQQQVQQQVQQQIRAVIEQQQHPSIIQQKISSLPVIQQHQQQQHTSSTQHQQQTQSHIMVQANIAPSKPKISQQQQTPTLIAPKPTDPTQTLIQSKNINQPQNILQTIVPSTSSSTTASLGNVKKSSALIKPTLPTVKLPPITSSGPPPLATVNTNITGTANIASSNTPVTINVDGLKDTNNKEEIKTIQSTPTVGTNQISNNTTSTSMEQTYAITTTTSVTCNTDCTTTSTGSISQQNQNQSSQPLTQQTSVAPSTLQSQQSSTIDAQWLYVCDWRYCPRKEFKSMSDLKHHIYTSHVPDFLDPLSEIFCQWGAGNFLCDKIPRKRYSLMTHIIDRHLTIESLKAAVQRRIETGLHNITPPKSPVTIVRNIELTQKGGNGSSPSPSTSSPSNCQTTGTGLSALQAIKRHTADFINSKELMDENEGPVTKSIRLTASLILRNLVTYTSTAKRNVRRFEPHLANIALSNVESSGTISHILYEMNV